MALQLLLFALQNNAYVGLIEPVFRRLRKSQLLSVSVECTDKILLTAPVLFPPFQVLLLLNLALIFPPSLLSLSLSPFFPPSTPLLSPALLLSLPGFPLIAEATPWLPAPLGLAYPNDHRSQSSEFSNLGSLVTSSTSLVPPTTHSSIRNQK